MARIGKTFTFDAAHRLQNHNGKCRSLHGHTYHVEVQIHGSIQENVTVTPGEGLLVPNPKLGMVIDFGKLKEWWKPLEAVLDHVTILETDDPIGAALMDVAEVRITSFDWPPTAENLATWLRQDLEAWLLKYVWPRGFQTPTVRVYETPTSWAES